MNRYSAGLPSYYLSGALLCGAWLGTNAQVVWAQTDVAPPVAPPTAGTASAGNAPTGTPGAPGTAGAPGGMPGMPPGAPPLSVILGFADLFIAIDRPYEAEKIYKQIQAGMPKMDPNDPKTQAMMAAMPKEMLEGMKQAKEAVDRGLNEVELAKRPTLTFLGHYYHDTHDVELYTYGGGPTFRTRYGRITLTAGTGHYRNNNREDNERNPLALTPTIPAALDNDTLKKSTLNFLYEGYFKKYEMNAFLSRTTYDAASDRWLYDLKLTYAKDPSREKYSVSIGRHDSFFQNINEQFFAPETYFQLSRRIVYDDASIAMEKPLAAKVDLGLSYRHFQYTDGNQRSNYRGFLMYRIKGDNLHPMPVFRVGLDAILDDSKFFTLDYSASIHFNALSAAMDYVKLTKSTKFGVYASRPIAQQNFQAPAAIFGLYSRKFGQDYEVYGKLGRLLAPGISLDFRDYVVGVNRAF